MNRLALILTKLLNPIYYFAPYASGISIILIAIIMFYDVVLRYFFDSPTYWADELSEYMIVWAVFISMAWVLKTNRHIRVELLFNRLSKGGKQTATVICILSSLFFFVLFIYASLKMALQSFSLGRTSISPLQMPMVIPHLSLVLGGILVFIQLLINLLDLIRSSSCGDHEAEKAK